LERLPEQKQIRAVYDKNTIRVYQAYNDAIADTALANNTFVSPPFSMTRMTWIKPSFLWMMYRSGWGKKDANQNRVLAIDICRHGFEWALKNACLSHPPEDLDPLEWKAKKAATPVRIQWDPERDFHFTALPYRSIQIGLTGEAVSKYAGEWIKQVTDITPMSEEMHRLVLNGQIEDAAKRLPLERAYEFLSPGAYGHIGIS